MGPRRKEGSAIFLLAATKFLTNNATLKDIDLYLTELYKQQKVASCAQHFLNTERQWLFQYTTSCNSFSWWFLITQSPLMLLDPAQVLVFQKTMQLSFTVFNDIFLVPIIFIWWWLFPHVRGFWEVRQFIPHLHFFFTWRLACAN